MQREHMGLVENSPILQVFQYLLIKYFHYTWPKERTIVDPNYKSKKYCNMRMKKTTIIYHRNVLLINTLIFHKDFPSFHFGII